MKQCMNFKFVILFALTLLVGSTVYGQDNVIDEVVWVVGDEANKTTNLKFIHFFILGVLY